MKQFNKIPMLKQVFGNDLIKMNNLMWKICQEKGWIEAKEIIFNKAKETINIVACEGNDILGGIIFQYGNSNKFLVKSNWDLIIPNNIKTSEVVLTAIEKSVRGYKIVFEALCCYILAYCIKNNIQTSYTILDERVYKLCLRVGFNYKKIEENEGGGDKIFWGEKTFPVIMDIQKTFSNLKIKNPIMWDYVNFLLKNNNVA